MEYLDTPNDGSHDESIPFRKKFLEWNDSQQELQIITWQQNNQWLEESDICQDGYCIINKVSIPSTRRSFTKEVSLFIASM